MRLTLGQLAPVPAHPARNVERIGAALRAAPADLAIFPELFLSGYRVGDRIHALALYPGGDDPVGRALLDIARATHTPILVGAPLRSADRPGELQNAAIVARPDGSFAAQVKRYLPNFGPFEEGLAFSPTASSRPIPVGPRSVGVEICYDVFFPEVTRDLALAGAELLVNVSASPVTSRRLFEHLLPARAVENGTPMVYVNRVGVEDGFVFGGGTGAWDHRGEPIDLEEVPLDGLGHEERLYRVDVDPAAVGRWRPFRPVLRDVTARPAASARE